MLHKSRTEDGQWREGAIDLAMADIRRVMNITEDSDGKFCVCLLANLLPIFFVCFTLIFSPVHAIFVNYLNINFK